MAPSNRENLIAEQKSMPFLNLAKAAIAKASSSIPIGMCTSIGWKRPKKEANSSKNFIRSYIFSSGDPTCIYLPTTDRQQAVAYRARLAYSPKDQIPCTWLRWMSLVFYNGPPPHPTRLRVGQVLLSIQELPDRLPVHPADVQPFYVYVLFLKAQDQQPPFDQKAKIHAPRTNAKYPRLGSIQELSPDNPW